MTEDELHARLERLEHTLERQEITLDEVVRLLKGEGPVHGLIERLERHDKTLYGADDVPGVVGKMQILWRTHVWAWCTLSACVGSSLTLVLVAILQQLTP
jgi:uncharacterized coiled-coil protein SlyX